MADKLRGGTTIGGNIAYHAGNIPTWNQDTTGNSGTATKLATARTIALTGDVTGSVSFDGTTNVSITATIADNSIVLGTDTTGNYVAGNTAGTGISVTGTAGEGWSPTIALTNVGAAGTYRSVTTDAQGRVTAGTNPTTLSGYGLTDVYTITESNTSLALKVNNSEKGVANGLATLDGNGKVVLTQIPDSVLGQLEYIGTWNFTTMPTATQKGQYWIASTSGNGYVVGDWAVWNGTAFDKVDNTDAVATVAGRTGNVVLTKTDVGLANVDNTADTAKPVSTAQATAIGLKADSLTVSSHTGNISNPHSVTKAQVGLGNVDNTLDASKPVSTAQQTALDLKANLASPTFTGTVTAPTFSGALSGNATSATTATNVAWSGVTSKPTTLSGYGITDAASSSHTHSRIYDEGGTGSNLRVSSGNELEFFNSSGAIVDMYLNYNGSAESVRGPGGATMLHTSNYNSYAPTLTGTGASGTWGINITGNAATATSATSASIAATATKLNAQGGDGIQSLSSGIEYSNAVCMREAPSGAGNSNDIYAPRLGFHWGGLVASSIALRSDGGFKFVNNPGTGYENVYANIFYGSLSGNAATATNATNADKLIGKNWYWSGQSGQPTWLWGGTDGTNMYVYNPSNFNVNYANSAGVANSVSAAVVGAATAGISAGGVGSYAFLEHMKGAAAPGANIAGSNLRYSNSGDNIGGTPSGTWRCMGAIISGESDGYSTLFLRIA